jgi:transcriptional regulator with XRE-family HTH domain
MLNQRQMLKFIRQKLNLDQAQLGEKLNLTASAVSNLERHKNELNDLYFPVLSEISGIPVDQIAKSVANSEFHHLKKPYKTPPEQLHTTSEPAPEYMTLNLLKETLDQKNQIIKQQQAFIDLLLKQVKES